MARAQCSIDGCDRTVHGRGWCYKHYERWLVTKDPLGVAPRRPVDRRPAGCSVKGCAGVAIALRLCVQHYRPDAGPDHAPTWPIRKRWEAKVNRSGPVPGHAPHLGPCWLWLAHLLPSGYGQLRVGTGKRPAHCVGYELLVGPIPPGMDLDHLCRNHACVNPGHLEPVPHKVNVLRGEGKMAKHARQTHCVNGHPLNGPDANLVPDPRLGRRICRTCQLERNSRRRAATRAEREAAANQ